MTDLSHILLHEAEEGLPFNAVSPPVFQTSNFSFDSFDALRAALSDELSSFIYTRGRNPTAEIVEAKIAALEHGEKAKLLGSGAAAITNAVMSCVAAGDHIVCVRDAYSWATRLIGTYLPRFGVTSTFVDGSDTDAVLAAIQPNTRLIYLESPTSLTFGLQDVPAIVAEARARGIRTIMDNSWATPLYCNPLDWGVDLVVHSASKYLGGHSDLVAGVIIGKKEDIDRIIRTESLQFGAVADPFMAWLLLRGLRTLHVRLPVHFEHGLEIARWLEARPEVDAVYHPFLPSHPQHELARRLMRGGGGLFSFRLRTRDLRAVRGFADSLRVFRMAVSWGGYESLALPIAAVYPKGSVPEDRIGMVRLHIGLESPEILREDLARGFEAIRISCGREY